MRTMAAPGCVGAVGITGTRRAKHVRTVWILAVSVTVMAVAALLAPGLAQAHRPATAKERAEIKRAIARGVRGPAYRIRIRDIKVSRVGPWAAASFAVEFKKGEKPVPGNTTLVKDHGRWFQAGAPDAPDRRPSKAVIADLDLYVAPPESSYPTATSRNSDVTAFLQFLLVVLALPALWQIPRVFWPVRLNAAGDVFTGLYRRYSIATFTGYASDLREWEESSVVGSIRGHTSGTLHSDGNFSGTTTISDNRKVFTAYYTAFFLTDDTGDTREAVAANVRPRIGQGHLVSAAWLVHNRKFGNAFLVYNHTTNRVYWEVTRSAMIPIKRGLTKMVLRLPTIYVTLLCLAIVTIPLLFVFALSAMFQLWIFRHHAGKRLLRALEGRASEFPSMRGQVREIA